MIEVDGDSHFTPEQMEYDAARTALLEDQGCRVIRFSNDDVMACLGAVVESIAEECT